MAGDLAELEELAGKMLAAIAPGQRSQVTRAIAFDLRRSQTRRIAAQRNPDGSAYAPRKPREPLRSKRGRIKRRAKASPMFKKLRRMMKASSTANEATVEFARSAVARIASVHHYGLRDRVSPDSSAEATYASRRLLGLTEEERARILELLVDRLGS